MYPNHYIIAPEVFMTWHREQADRERLIRSCRPSRRPVVDVVATRLGAGLIAAGHRLQGTPSISASTNPASLQHL